MTDSASTATTPTPRRLASAGTARANLRRGAVLTAIAAVLFPRLNAVLHDGRAFWQLDTEAAVLIPIIVAITVVLFAVVGGWAWRASTQNRAATVALAGGILALVGIVAFWISAPIVLGGLAVTLGAEGRRRSVVEGRAKRALVATILGSLGAIVGAAMWLVGA